MWLCGNQCLRRDLLGTAAVCGSRSDGRASNAGFCLLSVLTQFTWHTGLSPRLSKDDRGKELRLWFRLTPVPA